MGCLAVYEQLIQEQPATEQVKRKLEARMMEMHEQVTHDLETRELKTLLHYSQRKTNSFVCVPLESGLAAGARAGDLDFVSDDLDAELFAGDFDEDALEGWLGAADA
ncbi:hypothetical protein PC118_g23089 [Phytophthora cactorum]|uniref:Uncharacterized protein n=1 Tax=Phytophthora cactorum TaxID=29920 RepID=A0A8T1EXX5_9STRA|nr:hypothetical protein PC111_g22881 [Phytophthora cactorum]KAG2824356.1 hypothetical protein PC113_g22049 [Phytophthora cactorum]KAG2959298.1 hypothetical protein PC118_g23089 [Phytophthora cactorum]KAG2963662.1 hypothetical protein PC119_g25442 [Phytophthora cactorum]KAG4038639.1 hypothetical protein PC123_g25797 [Phytophthora cactorum]